MQQSLPVSWASMDVAFKVPKLTAGCRAYVKAKDCCGITPYSPSASPRKPACTRKLVVIAWEYSHVMQKSQIRAAIRFRHPGSWVQRAPVLEHQNWVPVQSAGSLQEGPLVGNQGSICQGCCNILRLERRGADKTLFSNQPLLCLANGLLTPCLVTFEMHMTLARVRQQLPSDSQRSDFDIPIH